MVRRQESGLRDDVPCVQVPAKHSVSLWLRRVSVRPEPGCLRRGLRAQEGRGGRQPHHGPATALEASSYRPGWLKEMQN